LIKTTYKKPTANIILNDEKFDTLPLRSGKRQGCPLSPLFFNILEVFANVIMQEKKRKGIQIGKEGIKLVTDDMVIYVQKPKESSIKNLLELISDYSKFAEYKVNM